MNGKDDTAIDPGIEWFMDGELWRCRRCDGALWYNDHGDVTRKRATCKGCETHTDQELVARCHEGGPSE